MELQKVSRRYRIRLLEEADVDDILRLSKGNPMFYRYCPPAATRKSILNDMKALPPGKLEVEKYYVGFFENEKLIAVMDMVFGYPDEEAVYIGLFMVERKVQGCGIGSIIIHEYADYMCTLGKKTIQLAFAKGNSQSEAFWQKNGFMKTGKEVENDGYIAVCMKRDL